MYERIRNFEENIYVTNLYNKFKNWRNGMPLSSKKYFLQKITT